MLRIRLASSLGSPAVLALPVGADEAGLLPVARPLPSRLTELAAAFLVDVAHTGAAGTVQALPRPLESPRLVLLVGVGAGDETGWRAAGAALARAAQKEERLTIALGTAPPPADRDAAEPDPEAGSATDARSGTEARSGAMPRAVVGSGADAGSGVEAGPVALRGLVEGLLLASYRFRQGADDPDTAPKLRRVTVLVDEVDPFAEALSLAEVTAEATYLARDLTNTPSMEKSPAWFAGRVTRAAANRAGVTVTVREPAALQAEGFGGIVAVGSGSARGPRLVELAWKPRDARRHVVLVGKGITFDTGGISIKPRDAMKLMRKDMGGAAAVVAAALGAASLRLPIRVTALAPLAENMVSGAAFRPGDVVRHYGGQTSEILNTDAEGRLVLADALAYAVRRLRPDLLVDLATLTGANAVALGKRTAALYSHSDELAQELDRAATAAGERVWRMPLVEDYTEGLGSEVADVVNAAEGPGSISAALYLREFVGTARDRWAHLDMSAPSWVDGADGELVKGATGWGTRTLLRWLSSLAGHR